MEQVNDGGGPVTSRRVRRSAQQWQALVEAQPSSGLGVGDYCDRHQLSAGCFYRWRRCLSEGGGARSPWCRRQRSAPSPEGFAAVRVVQDRQPGVGGEVIRLALCGGRELILPASTPVRRLVELVMALEDESLKPERER
jgi:transposase-like protein